MPIPKGIPLIKLESLSDIQKHCEIVPFSGCWIWMRTTINGYGKMKYYGMIHRLSYKFANDKDAVGSVCHHCDVKSCVNPFHLYDGNHSTNQKDAIARGQSANPPRKPPALTEVDMRMIAMLMNFGLGIYASCKALGKNYQSSQVAGRREIIKGFLDEYRAMP